LQALLAFILAFVIAVAGTAFHQSNIGSLPIGITLAFAAVLLGSIEARGLGGARYLFPIFLAICMFVFSQDWTGDKLIPANSLGFAWSYGTLAIAVVFCLWPLYPKPKKVAAEDSPN
jgi:hypothetical protein